MSCVLLFSKSLLGHQFTDLEAWSDVLVVELGDKGRYASLHCCISTHGKAVWLQILSGLQAWTLQAVQPFETPRSDSL